MLTNGYIELSLIKNYISTIMELGTPLFDFEVYDNNYMWSYWYCGKYAHIFFKNENDYIQFCLTYT